MVANTVPNTFPLPPVDKVPPSTTIVMIFIVNVLPRSDFATL